MTRMFEPTPGAYSDDWAIYSKVNHRLPLLDSPHPEGWTITELAAEYNCSIGWMTKVMRKMVQRRDALQVGQRFTAP